MKKSQENKASRKALEEKVKELEAQLRVERDLVRSLDLQIEVLRGQTGKYDSMVSRNAMLEEVVGILLAYTGKVDMERALIATAAKKENISSAAINYLSELKVMAKPTAPTLVLTTQGSSITTRLFSLGESGLELLGLLTEIHIHVKPKSFMMAVSTPSASGVKPDSAASLLAKTRSTLGSFPFVNLSSDTPEIKSGDER